MTERERLEVSLPAPRGPITLAPRAPGPAPLSLSVIIPTYNEREGLGALIEELSAVLDQRFGADYEIILVDDDSPDGTGEAALALAARHPQLRLLRRHGERGLASAVARGFQVARSEVFCVMNADLQHPPEVIAALYEQMARGADLALASRHIEGGGVSEWSLKRRIVSRSAQLLGLLVLPEVLGRVSDPMSGYFMIRRRTLEGVVLEPLGPKILIEVLARGHIEWIGEVPYVCRERASGSSKSTVRIFLDYLRHLLRLRFSTLPVSRFFRFAAVGSSGVIVDMGMLFLLSDPSMLGWGLTRSKLIGAELALINNFLWNDLWTFGDISSRQPGWRARLRRFGKFQLICLAGALINTALLNVQFNLLGMNRYVANAVAILVVTGWNFWLNLKLSWRVAQA